MAVCLADIIKSDLRGEGRSHCDDHYSGSGHKPRRLRVTSALIMPGQGPGCQ